MKTTKFQLKITLLGLLIFVIGNLFYCYEFVVQVAPSAMVRELMVAFSANATTLSILASSFYWSYTSMQIPAGLLLDRYGARLMLTLVTVICALGTFMLGITHNIPVAVVGRLLMGASGAFAFTGAIAIIIRWLPPQTLAMFVGIVQLIGCIGAIAGGSLLASILHHYTWRNVMLTLAIVGIAIAIITWLGVRNNPQRFSEEKKQRLPMLKALQEVLTNLQTWPIALYSFAIWGPIVAFAALWGIPFLKTSLNVNAFQAANGIALIWIGIAVSSPFVGVLSDKIGRRCILLTISAFIGLFSSLLIIYVPNLAKPFLFFALFLMGIAAGGQSLAFGIVRDNNKIATTGAANGFNNMAAVLGGIILQPLIGKILDKYWDGMSLHGIRIYSLQDYHTALLILPICFLLAALTSMFLIKETYCTMQNE